MIGRSISLFTVMNKVILNSQAFIKKERGKSVYKEVCCISKN